MLLTTTLRSCLILQCIHTAQVFAYDSHHPSLQILNLAYPHMYPRATHDFHSDTSSSADLQDLQTFHSAIADQKAPGIHISHDKKKPFMVQDKAFADFSSAAMKSCEVQLQECKKAVGKSGDAESVVSTVTKESGSATLAGATKAAGGALPAFSNPVLRLNTVNSSVALNLTNATNSTNGRNSTASRVSAHSFDVNDCAAQQAQCSAAQKNAKVQSFRLEYFGADPEDGEYDLYCEV